MMKVELKRVHENEQGSYGVFLIDNSPVFTTLELPWRENQRLISCIPKGLYECEAYFSKRYGQVYRVLEVPGRDGILIHAGNFRKDTTGCILLGKGFILRKGISMSQLALQELRGLIEVSKFHLEIN